MRFTRARRAAAEITLTPLIDILFIVLLFLVLTATFTEQTTLRVALPAADTADPAEPPDAIRIEVGADGTIRFDDQPRTLDDLERHLRTMTDPGGATVRLAADERAQHGQVIAIIDRVRRAGIPAIAIETRRGAGLR